jgi:hypothetical protein
MSKNSADHETPVQPSLANLMSKYLQEQSAAHGAGLATTDLASEVVLYDAGPVQPIDARVAWLEATAVVKFFGRETETIPVPPQWPQLVAAHEPAAALAFCSGNFPQLLRNLQLLLHKTDLAKLRPETSQPIPAPALVEWAEKLSRKPQFPNLLLAVGALRLARQFDVANFLIRKHDANVSADWEAAWENEKAALAWHSGQTNEARAMWRNQTASVPVLFNRGMSALFSGQPVEARTALTEAVAQLPENGAWHHLGQLYLTLTETNN